MSQISYPCSVADQIEETIRSLRSLGHSTDVDPGKVMRRVRAESERRCAAGDTGYLGDLGVALLACHQAEPRAWQYLHAFDHLFRLLAGEDGGSGRPGESGESGQFGESRDSGESGDSDLTQTLRLIAASRAAGHGIEALAAALLAQNRPQAALAAASDGTGAAGDMFRACLVHELVLREEGRVAQSPKIVRWAGSTAMRSHPLGWLPLALLDVEQGWDKGLGDMVEPDRETMVVAGAQPLWPATDVTTVELSEALSAAVQNWADDSNGEIEAKVFNLGVPVTPATIATALPALELECLEPGTIPFRLAVSDSSARVAWWVLFHAALDGSAYGRGRYGAYSRLYAWRSLAALAGAAEDAGPEEVAALAQQCTWYRFDADSAWYTQVFWDIGLVAVRPDGRSLAVLAATDTD